MKSCGISYEELMSKIGSLSSLSNGDQLELTKLLDENNKAIKSYIDEVTNPKNTNKKLSEHIVNDMRRKGMR